MIQLINGLDNPILNTDDFYITEKWSGLDELVFEISIYDPAYSSILEEAVVQYKQPYLVKAIDSGANTAKVKCQLDVDALKADMLLSYTNGSATVHATVSGVLPAGWTVLDHSGRDQRRTIEGEAYTPLEVVQACLDVYGVAVRFDAAGKVIHIYDPDGFQPLGAFASRELNLKEINFKGKSAGFATRLYAYGKDGMSFASINEGKPYVEDYSYSNKVVSAYWKDERYTVPENLLADAKRNLREMAQPARSYNCSVHDLAAANPEMYGFQDFSLFSIVKLIDDARGTSLLHQVMEYRRYPEYPEKNEVTLSTVAPSLTKSVKNIQNMIEKPTSSFRQQMQTLIENMAASIAGYDGGNLVITQNSEGKPNGLMIMDTDDRTTARKVMWLNLAGITYSQNGAGGPFDTVWSFEKNGFGADWIVAGTMLADRILGGTLTLGGKNNGNGMFRILDASGKQIGYINNTGVHFNKGTFAGELSAATGSFAGELKAATGSFAGKVEAGSGKIGGWDIGSQAIYKDITASDGTIYRVCLQPPLASAPDSSVVVSCQKSTDKGKRFSDIFALYSNGYVFAGAGNVELYPGGGASFGGGRVRFFENGTIIWYDSNGKYAAQMVEQSDGTYNLSLGAGKVIAKNVPNVLNRYTGTVYTKDQGDRPISLYVQDGLIVSVNG